MTDQSATEEGLDLSFSLDGLEGWLRKAVEPFPREMISHKPQPTCPACNASNREKRGPTCDQHQKTWCETCKQYVGGPHMCIEYVNHALVTLRLAQVDPDWSWRPLGGDLTTALIRSKNRISLWGEMTVNGVTRVEVGTANEGPEEMKNAISDFLKRAAMRYLVNIHSWIKGDLAAALGGQSTEDEPQHIDPPKSDWELAGWQTLEAATAARNSLVSALKHVPAEDRPPLREALTGLSRGYGAGGMLDDEGKVPLLFTPAAAGQAMTYIENALPRDVPEPEPEPASEPTATTRRRPAPAGGKADRRAPHTIITDTVNQGMTVEKARTAVETLKRQGLWPVPNNEEGPLAAALAITHLVDPDYERIESFKRLEELA